MSDSDKEIPQKTPGGELLEVKKIGKELFIVRRGEQHLPPRGVFKKITVSVPQKSGERGIGYIYYKIHEGKLRGKRIVMAAIPAQGTEAHIWPGILVEKEMRRKGLARLMLEHLKNEAEKEGCERIDAISPQGPAKKLYREMGFKKKRTLGILPFGRHTLDLTKKERKRI